MAKRKERNVTESKKSYYAVIPANVRYDESLPPNAKLLYGEITALCNAEGYCWASNKFFADLYGVTTTTISLWIKALIERGYIQSEIVYKEGTKEILNRYLTILNYPIKENLNTPIEENLKDNNTSINNTLNTTNEYSNKSDKPYEEIINYLNEKADKKYRANNKATQKHINARLTEGYTVDDFKTVIDKKCTEWKNTDMEQYLRPETLFGTKFEGYLNAKINKTSGGDKNGIQRSTTEENQFSKWITGGTVL